MRRKRREVGRARWPAVVASACLLVLGAVACGDTRLRPVPPDLDIAFDTTQILRSPGVFLATVNIAAPAGVDFTQMTLSAGVTVFLDTLQGYIGETEVVRPVQWLIPPGIAPGTTLRFRVLVRDFIDFETVDSLEFVTVP